MGENLYKHILIACSSKCSAKPLSILFAELCTNIKQDLEKYCEIAYSKSGVNQMGMLKNSKEFLKYMKPCNKQTFTYATIKCINFSFVAEILKGHENHSNPRLNIIFPKRCYNSII